MGSAMCVDREQPAGNDRQASRAGADGEFAQFWTELLLSRMGAKREHRLQANSHATRLNAQ